jgi:hypothetical protein
VGELQKKQTVDQTRFFDWYFRYINHSIAVRYRLDRIPDFPLKENIDAKVQAREKFGEMEFQSCRGGAREVKNRRWFLSGEINRLFR